MRFVVRGRGGLKDWRDGGDLSEQTEDSPSFWTREWIGSLDVKQKCSAGGSETKGRTGLAWVRACASRRRSEHGPSSTLKAHMMIPKWEGGWHMKQRSELSLVISEAVITGTS